VTGLLLLLGAAAVGHGVARAFRVPAIPLLLLAGVLLGPLGLLEADFLQDALVLGVTFLVFVAGIELNPTRVGAWRGVAARVGVVQFVVLGALGLGAALLMGFGSQESYYLALALTASSTLVGVRVLQSRRQLFEPFGRLVIGVLLLQDLLVVALIPVVTLLPEGGEAVLRGLGATLLLGGLAFVLLRWVLPPALKRFGLEEEPLLLVVLALLFLFLFLADRMGLPLVSGAFLAGVALSPFPVNGQIRGQLTSVSDFFSAILFTALGASLGLPTVAELLQALAFIALVLVVTPPLVALVAERAGFSARPAILGGLLLSQTSEFSLVVGLQGVVAGHLDNGVFTIITLVTVVTMILTPFLASDRVSLTLLHLHPSRRAGEPEEPPEGHILLLGCGENGIAILETLLIGPYPLVAVDDDPQVVERIVEAGIQAFRGDVVDEKLLRRAGADRARLIISTVRRVEDNETLLEMVGEVPVIARAFNVEDAEWLGARGARPVLYSEAAADAFLEWFHRKGWEEELDLEEREREEVV